MVLQYYIHLISLPAVVLTHFNNDLDVRLSLIPTYIIVRWSLLRFVRLGRIGIGLDYKMLTHTLINQKLLPIDSQVLKS